MSEASLLYMSRWKRNVESQRHVRQVERCRTFGCQLSLPRYFRQKSVVGWLESVRSFVDIHFGDLRLQVFPLPEEKQFFISHHQILAEAPVNFEIQMEGQLDAQVRRVATFAEFRSRKCSASCAFERRCTQELWR